MKRLKRPPSQELLNQAADLLSDGASQREVCRTTGLARETIRKHFPGKGWTYVEGGEFRALTKNTPIEKGLAA
jgi:DNA invertase Pin-like site-specific DNA recombinase